jgi:hypothetical protein
MVALPAAWVKTKPSITTCAAGAVTAKPLAPAISTPPMVSARIVIGASAVPRLRTAIADTAAYDPSLTTMTSPGPASFIFACKSAMESTA